MNSMGKYLEIEEEFQTVSKEEPQRDLLDIIIELKEYCNRKGMKAVVSFEIL